MRRELLLLLLPVFLYTDMEIYLYLSIYVYIYVYIYRYTHHVVCVYIRRTGVEVLKLNQTADARVPGRARVCAYR